MQAYKHTSTQAHKHMCVPVYALPGLVQLDVLDLHGNAITSLRGIESLRSLRVLNLASNLIKDVRGRAILRVVLRSRCSSCSSCSCSCS